jgi:hypothetical protein
MESTPSAAPQAVLFPRWLGLAIVVLLSLQLALGYVQGALLNRQKEELRALRSDLQDLAEAVEQSHGASAGDPEAGEVWRPLALRRPGKPAHAVVARTVLDVDEDERARKELQQSLDSGKKAVADSRKAQEQVSITENARKAEVRKDIDKAENHWLKGSLLALGLVTLGLLARAWFRRRG